MRMNTASRPRTRSTGLMLGVLALPLVGSCGGDTPPPAKLQLYETCGDPVCRGYTAPMGVPLCTTEKVGDVCTTAGKTCDPKSMCNALYICATADPKMAPGGCPISRRKYKTEIKYLEPTDVQRYADELARVKLATYRYKTGGPTHLGFILEDQEPSVSVDSARDMVDLYGYTSLTVAAVQAQERKLQALRAELTALRAELAKLRPRQR